MCLAFPPPLCMPRKGVFVTVLAAFFGRRYRSRSSPEGTRKDSIVPRSSAFWGRGAAPCRRGIHDQSTFGILGALLRNLFGAVLRSCWKSSFPRCLRMRKISSAFWGRFQWEFSAFWGREIGILGAHNPICSCIRSSSRQQPVCGNLEIPESMNRAAFGRGKRTGSRNVV
jgi:hypothetical protein